jgi:hypothetical protein
MGTAIIVGLIGAAGTVVASVLSALIHRSRAGSTPYSHPGSAAVVLVRRPSTFRARLAVGLSALAVVIGLSAATLSRGGWFNQTPRSGDSWLVTPLTDLSEAVGFRPVSLVPLTGLGLALVGAVGLVVGWAASAPQPVRYADPGDVPDPAIM